MIFRRNSKSETRFLVSKFLACLYVEPEAERQKTSLWARVWPPHLVAQPLLALKGLGFVPLEGCGLRIFKEETPGLRAGKFCC